MLRGNFAGAVAGVASEKQSPPEQGRVFPAIQPACPPRSRREQGFPLKPNPLCSDPQSRATPPHPPVPFPVMPGLSTCREAYTQPRLASRPPTDCSSSTACALLQRLSWFCLHHPEEGETHIT